MRKMLLIALISTLLLATCCVHLPLKSERPDVNDVLQMNKILSGITYPHAHEYGVFDCSNETALLFEYFTAKGFQCEIITGWKPVWQWHAWLIAEKNGKKYWIDPIEKRVVGPGYFSDFTVKFRFRSLETLRFWSKMIFMPEEWQY